MNIVVWSDIACPFCYIAGTRVRRALKALHAEDLFTIERKSYELSPQITVSEPCLSFYAKKMDVTEEDIAPGLRKIEREAAKDGLVFHYDRAIAANTFNATGSSSTPRRTACRTCLTASSRLISATVST